jgi:hypothetical protein
MKSSAFHGRGATMTTSMRSISQISASESNAEDKPDKDKLVHSRPTLGESRFRKFGQDDKWNFCLKAAMIAVNRRDHEQTTAPEPLTGLQGEGGAGRHQG